MLSWEAGWADTDFKWRGLCFANRALLGTDARAPREGAPPSPGMSCLGFLGEILKVVELDGQWSVTSRLRDLDRRYLVAAR
jgi:hypothetical protein